MQIGGKSAFGSSARRHPNHLARQQQSATPRAEGAAASFDEVDLDADPSTEVASSP
jgi:hypothetical protein